MHCIADDDYDDGSNDDNDDDDYDDDDDDVPVSEHQYPPVAQHTPPSA